MVTYGIKGSSAVYYRIWDGSSWSTEASVPAAGGVTGDATWLVTATDYTTDRIALGDHEQGGEVWLNVWDGSAWERRCWPRPAPLALIYPNLAVAFESSTGQALAVYGESGSSIVRYRTWDAAGGWSAEQSGPNIGAVPNSMTLDSGPTSDSIMLSVQDAATTSLGAVGWQQLGEQDNPVDQHRRDQEPAVRVHLRPGGCWSSQMRRRSTRCRRRRIPRSTRRWCSVPPTAT